MTRKDYQMIAATIANSTLFAHSIAETALREVVLNLCKAFRADNPRFDDIKFTKACGF